MYIHKELFEDSKYHKYIFTVHDYKENTSGVMKESEIKGHIVFTISFEDLNCIILNFNINKL